MSPESQENAGKSPTITARQAIAIDSLATGLPITRVAETTGIGRRTIHRWLGEGDFLEALEARKQQLRDRVADEVSDLAIACLSTVKDYLGSEDERQTSYKPARVDLSVSLLEKMGLVGGKPVAPKNQT